MIHLWPTNVKFSLILPIETICQNWQQTLSLYGILCPVFQNWARIWIHSTRQSDTPKIDSWYFCIKTLVSYTVTSHSQLILYYKTDQLRLTCWDIIHRAWRDSERRHRGFCSSAPCRSSRSADRREACLTMPGTCQRTTEASIQNREMQSGISWGENWFFIFLTLSFFLYF